MILSEHRAELEGQMAELVANLDEVKVHEKEAKALLAKSEANSQAKSDIKTHKKAAK
jgi:hypothetical protein